jgi:glycosyltransferase involved in cell wall biosynthesis
MDLLLIYRIIRLSTQLLRVSVACGTPVIGANVGGIKYSVVDGATGYLVPPENPFALAGKLSKVLADEHLDQQMSREAIKRVNRYFTWKKVSSEIAALYGSLVPQRQQFTQGPSPVMEYLKKAI